MKKGAKIALLGAGLTALAAGLTAVCYIDRENSYFTCPRCEEEFVPTLPEYIMGPHTLRRRRLKCPVCGNVSWCKQKYL